MTVVSLVLRKLGEALAMRLRPQHRPLLREKRYAEPREGRFFFHRVATVIRWLPVVALAASGLAQAQAWPSKPVRIVVPIAGGSATDLLARLVGQALAQATGQPFVVENKTGAAGAIGSAEVARAPADGYTLLVATTSTHSIAPHVSTKLPYDVVDDFTPPELARRSVSRGRACLADCGMRST